MSLSPCIQELRNDWLPHITMSGLERLIDLLEKDSPLLIHGAFTRAIPMGCLATHIAWHHPQTNQLTVEAGVTWLCKVAGLNPGTSQVIRRWDLAGTKDWEFRELLLSELKAERDRRNGVSTAKQPIHESIYDLMTTC